MYRPRSRVGLRGLLLYWSIIVHIPFLNIAVRPWKSSWLTERRDIRNSCTKNTSIHTPFNCTIPFFLVCTSFVSPSLMVIFASAIASGKKIYVRTHRRHLDAPGARDALDAPWQGTYRSQCETHRQCEFGRSTPWHHAFRRRMPGRRASGRSWHGICLPDSVCQGIFFLDAAVSGYFLLDGACQGIFLLDAAMSGHFLLDAAVSGHFPSGRSRVSAFPTGCSCVRVFCFGTQPCQGKWRPDDVCHGTAVTLAVKAQNITANTLVAFANMQRVPGIVTQYSSILYI